MQPRNELISNTVMMIYPDLYSYSKLSSGYIFSCLLGVFFMSVELRENDIWDTIVCPLSGEARCPFN